MMLSCVHARFNSELFSVSMSISTCLCMTCLLQLNDNNWATRMWRAMLVLFAALTWTRSFVGNLGSLSLIVTTTE